MTSKIAANHTIHSHADSMDTDNEDVSPQEIDEAMGAGPTSGFSTSLRKRKRQEPTTASERAEADLERLQLALDGYILRLDNLSSKYGPNRDHEIAIDLLGLGSTEQAIDSLLARSDRPALRKEATNKTEKYIKTINRLVDLFQRRGCTEVAEAARAHADRAKSVCTRLHDLLMSNQVPAPRSPRQQPQQQTPVERQNPIQLTRINHRTMPLDESDEGEGAGSENQDEEQHQHQQRRDGDEEENTRSQPSMDDFIVPPLVATDTVVGNQGRISINQVLGMNDWEGKPFKLTDYHRCYFFVLSMLKTYRLKRHKKWACQRQITADEQDTRHYVAVMSIEDFVLRKCADKHNFAQYYLKGLGDPSVQSKIIKALSRSQADEEWPCLKKNRRVLSFENGVLVAPHKSGPVTKTHQRLGIQRKAHFVTYEEADDELPADLCSANYIPFELNPEWMDDSFDPDLIPTPAMDQLIRTQRWGRQVERWFFAMHYGRIIFPTGEWDDWQVAPFDLGVAGTGKSCNIKTMMRIFESCDVYSMANNAQPQFSMANAFKCFLLLFPEVKKKLTMDQAVFQSAISGDDMELAQKHIQETIMANPWDVPLALAGNDLPDFPDASGSIVRRLLVFAFNHQVARPDPSLQARLIRELPALIAKGIRHYLRFLAMYGHRGIWDEGDKDTTTNSVTEAMETENVDEYDELDMGRDEEFVPDNMLRPINHGSVLPRFFHDQRSAVDAETNPLVDFITSSEVVRGKGLYVSYSEFRKAYTTYLRESGHSQVVLSPQNLTSVMPRYGLSRQDAHLAYPRSSATRKHSRYIMGIDLARNCLPEELAGLPTTATATAVPATNVV